MLDVGNKDYVSARRHAETALDYGRNNTTAQAVLLLAEKALGGDTTQMVRELLCADPLNHLLRFLSDSSNFYDLLESNPLETCLDLAADLAAMGEYAKIEELLSGLLKAKPNSAQPMLYYALGYFRFLSGKDGTEDYQKRGAGDDRRNLPRAKRRTKNSWRCHQTHGRQPGKNAFGMSFVQ